MANDPMNSRQRTLWQKVMGRPWNQKGRKKKTPPTGDFIGKDPLKTSSKYNKGVVPNIQTFPTPPPIDDGSYSTNSFGPDGKLKKVTYYNKDGKRIPKPKNK